MDKTILKVTPYNFSISPTCGFAFGDIYIYSTSGT